MKHGKNRTLGPQRRDCTWGWAAPVPLSMVLSVLLLTAQHSDHSRAILPSLARVLPWHAKSGRCGS